MPSKQVRYKDFDIRFKAHPATGRLLMKKDAESVKQGIKNLILTNIFERPYKPLFGSDISHRLFDLYDPATEANVKSDVRTAMENYSDRAELLDVTVTGNPDSNELHVNIIFRPTNSTKEESFSLSLQRLR